MITKKFLKSKPVCKATFTLDEATAANAKEAIIVGEFNDWNIEEGVAMKKRKGTFKATVELEKGKEYQFRYLIDGKVWANDLEADDYIASPFGEENCIVSTLS